MNNPSPSYPAVPAPGDQPKPSPVAPQYGFPTGFREMAFGASNIYGKTYATARTTQFLVRRLQSSVVTQYRKGSPVAASPRPTSNASSAIPYVTGVSASVTTSTYGGAGFTKLVVSFSVPANQRNWKYARVYLKNFQGNPNFVLIGESTQSPFTALVQATGETVIVAVGSRSPFGEVNDFTKAPSTAVTLTTSTGGSVTSVGLAGPTGIVISGSPVTSSGTLTWAMPTGWTTGDLLLGNGSNSVSRLPIGTNGQVLTSNGTTASWQPGGSSGALTRIAQTVVSTPVNSVTFSSIPGTYTNLMLIGQGRCSDAATFGLVDIQFNSDTGTNYYSEQMQGFSTTVNASAGSATTSLSAGAFPAANASANVAAPLTAWVQSYAGTTFYKNISILTGRFETLGTTASYVTQAIEGLWKSTSAMTSITIIDGSGGNFVAGTTFTLYGVQ